MAGGTITLNVQNMKIVKDELKQLRDELAITDKLLNTRNETLALIPECPVHGPQCQPHMREWIEKAKATMDEAES